MSSDKFGSSLWEITMSHIPLFVSQAMFPPVLDTGRQQQTGKVC